MYNQLAQIMDSASAAKTIYSFIREWGGIKPQNIIDMPKRTGILEIWSPINFGVVSCRVTASKMCCLD
jgi:hypothetical protein